MCRYLTCLDIQCFFLFCCSERSVNKKKEFAIKKTKRLSYFLLQLAAVFIQNTLNCCLLQMKSMRTV